MKKVFSMTLVLSFCILALAGTAFAQTVLINENFDSVTTPNFPTGWSVDNTNADGYTWESYSSSSYACSGNQMAAIRWNSSAAMDDWLFTPVLALDSTHNYTLVFNYRVASSTYPENLTVYIGTTATPAGQTTQLVDLASITTTTCTASGTPFTVPTTGSYYIGFHGHSLANEFRLIVDDVVVTDTTVPVELQSFSIE